MGCNKSSTFHERELFFYLSFDNSPLNGANCILFAFASVTTGARRKGASEKGITDYDVTFGTPPIRKSPNKMLNGAMS